MSATSTQIGGDHYRSMTIQPERFIYENGIGFHEGSAIKYLCRWRLKGGVQDLEKAKHFIDLLIAHQGSDCGARCGNHVCDKPKGHTGGHSDDALLWRGDCPEPPAPELPRLNAGWKWAEVGVHIYTKFDKWLTEDGVWFHAYGEIIGKVVDSKAPYPVATPDWHNPENIESPGEGYRFLVKEEAACNGDEYFAGTHWTPNTEVKDWEWRLWTHRTTRPLPPCLGSIRGGSGRQATARTRSLHSMSGEKMTAG